jgi:hypothetical protein
MLFDDDEEDDEEGQDAIDKKDIPCSKRYGGWYP